MASGYFHLTSVYTPVEMRVYYKSITNTSLNKSILTLTYRAKINQNSSIVTKNDNFNCIYGIIDRDNIRVDSFDSKTIQKMLYRDNVSWDDDKTFLCEFEVEVYHGLDGTRNIQIDADVDMLWEGVKYANNYNVTLDKIVKKAYINTAENFSDVIYPTITYYNPMGNYIDKLQACIADSRGIEIFVPYRDIPKTGNTYTFNLTNEEIQTLISNVGADGSLAVRFYVRTTEDGYNYLSSIAKTFSIEAEPLLNPTVIDVDEITTALTGDNNVFIRYFSDASIVVNAEGQKGATITSQGAACGNKSFTGASGVIENVESATFVINATDSRGATAANTIEKTLIPYTKLTCNISASINVDGTAQLTVEGDYYNHSFGAIANTLLVQCRIKENSSEWEDWEGIEYLSDDNTYKITKSYDNLDYRQEYTFEARAIDKLDTVYSEEFKFKVKPLFDWGKDDFNFNCDVVINGNLTVNGEGSSNIGDKVIEIGTEEMGSNGTWYWRKWESGRAECYGKRNYGNMAVNVAWGSLYTSADFNQSLPSGLFVDTPEVIQINILSSDRAGWILQGFTYEATPADATSTGSFNVVRPANATLS